MLNAANEVAGDAFLGGRLRFPQIAQVIDHVLGKRSSEAAPDLTGILQADARARDAAAACVARLMGRAA